MHHRAVTDFLTAIFYPVLTNVKIEQETHQGRKRIDITYDNNATAGFFSWVNRAFPFLLLPVECKNYEKDQKNPELDQMIGRFSDFRGRIGIITCRSFDNKDLFLARCKDTANDRNGFIIVLDDDDLEVLAKEAALLQGEADRGKRFVYSLIRQRFDMLISAG